MVNIKVFPGKLKGIIQVPGSKSFAHRAMICAALGAGASEIKGFSLSDDLQATLAGIQALGAITEQRGDVLQIIGLRRADDRQKWAEKFASQTWRLQTKPESVLIQCKESGSTLRFLLPLALIRTSSARFIGSGNLGKRPMEPYFKIFQEQNIRYQENEHDENLDLRVWGEFHPGQFQLPGNISSQFISGLLFALPLLKEDSQIKLTTALESQDYVAMTLKVMQEFGVVIGNQGYNNFNVEGRQRYQSTTYNIESDYSQAAFYLVADALGSMVDVAGLKANSLQGDQIIIKLLQSMGCDLKQGDQGILIKANSAGLKAITIDGSQCPDLIPILALAACLSQGNTEIINAQRLRIKESDRLQATSQELNKLGAKVIERPDGLLIQGVKTLQGGQKVWSHGDHRIAMMLAIAATCCKEPIIIEDAECVAKSYPNFWQDYQSLAGQIKWEVK